MQNRKASISFLSLFSKLWLCIVIWWPDQFTASRLLIPINEISSVVKRKFKRCFSEWFLNLAMESIIFREYIRSRVRYRVDRSPSSPSNWSKLIKLLRLHFSLQHSHLSDILIGEKEDRCTSRKCEQYYWYDPCWLCLQLYYCYCSKDIRPIIKKFKTNRYTIEQFF